MLMHSATKFKVLLVLAAGIFSGCIQNTHGETAHFFAGNLTEDTPVWSMNWANVTAQPPEFVELVHKIDERISNGQESSATLRVSPTRYEELLEFLQTEWSRQTSQSPPANLVFPIEYQGRIFETYLARTN